MVISKPNQEVTLVNGEFNPAEAQKIICSSIKNHIKEAKIESMQKWVRNHDYDFNHCEDIQDQLTQQEKDIMQLIERARFEGKNLEISTKIIVKLSDSSN